LQALAYSGVLANTAQRLPDVISLLLVEVALSIPLRLYQSILRAEVRYTDIGVFEIIRIVLRLLGIPLLLWLGGGLIAILVYASCINVLFFALMMGSVYRRDRTFYIDWQAVDWQHVRELLSFSRYAAITQVAEFFKYRTDNVLVGLLLGVSAVAPYAIMVVVIDMLTQILMRFQSYWDTIIMRHAGEQRFASAWDTTLKSLQIGIALALLATFDTWLISTPFLSLWVGDAYTHLALPLTLFTLILPGLAVQLATSPYFNALGKQRLNAGLALLEILLKLVVVLPLAHLWAANGVIAASILAASAVALLRLNVVAGMLQCTFTHLARLILCQLSPILLLLSLLWSVTSVLHWLGLPVLLSALLILGLQGIVLLFFIKKPANTRHPVLSAICPRPRGGV
jgi:O-antigen/teichoic acid export membrane protein